MKKSIFYLFLTVTMTFLISCGMLYPTHRTRGQYHRVQKKETVYALSRKFKTPVQDIIKTNKLKPPYGLKIGQMVYIPGAKYYEVRKGDTLYSISKSFDIPSALFAQHNDLEEPWTLKVGQKLFIPTSTTPPPPKQAENKTINKAKTTKTAAIILPSTPKRSGRFTQPISGKVISQFGPSGNGRHNDGINISASKGTAIKAAENGVVAYAGNKLKGFGNLVLIKHSDGWVTAYAHADSFSVKKGSVVKKGDIIGKVGSTGNVKTPQLHFEIRKGTKAVDPLKYLK